MIDENIDVQFLNETDTIQLQKEGDFAINGYSTIFQKRVDNSEKLRLICLVKESLMKNITVRKDLMSTDYPSICLELKENNKQTVLLAGFYREWNQKGNKSEANQIKVLLKNYENKLLLLLLLWFW